MTLIPGPALPADFLYTPNQAPDQAFVRTLAQSLQQELLTAHPSLAGNPDRFLRPGSSQWPIRLFFEVAVPPGLGYRLAFSHEAVQIAGGMFEASAPEQQRIRQLLWEQPGRWKFWEDSREWFKHLGDLIPQPTEALESPWRVRTEEWPTLGYAAWYWQKAYLLKPYRGQEGLHEFIMQFFRLLHGPITFLGST